MVGMPWVFEQGTVLSVIDDYLSDRGRAVMALHELRPKPLGLGLPVARSAGLSSTNLQSFLIDGVNMSASRHLEEHWFGHDRNGEPVTPRWLGWSGDAESIMRWALICGIERSLGLPHISPAEVAGFSGEPSPSTAGTQHWPVHVYWSCGAPFFQGWVSWHLHGNGDTGGVVNIVLCTPGNGEQINATPIDRNPQTSSLPDGETSARIVGNHGLWVVGEAVTEKVYGSVTVIVPNAPGQGLLPTSYAGLRLRTSGGIVISAPSEATGGVLRSGRRFKPASP